MFIDIDARKTAGIVTLFLVLFVLIGNASGNKIHLKGNTFVPEESQAPENRVGTNSLQTQSHEEEYMILQFHKPVKKQYRENLSRKEINFISYIPENAWITKITGDKTEIISEEKVRSLTPYKSSFKIDPKLKKDLKNNSGKLKVRVEVFSSSKNTKDLLENYGAVKGKFDSLTWRVETSYSNISDISEEKHVKWISKEPPAFETKNDDSRALIGVNTLQSSPYNLRGQGFTAGIWDGGSVKRHDDLNYTGKTVLGEDNGVSNHAVHVAGTMLGGGRIDLGSGTPNRFRGMAYDASLVSYDFGYIDSTELYNEVDESITSYDSILSQNSWGWDMSEADESLLGDYTQDSALFDKIVSGETSEVSEKISVIFAAGNEGDSYSPRYNTTTGPGATSKNTITVGAVNDTGGMTSYSSWGPTDDGRIKPTLVADGGQSGATIGSPYPSGSGYYPYAGLTGTSMAAPAVSGTVILLNEQFNKTYDRLPEPATVKGSLIHTAEDLGRKGPDYKFGWGLVNATEAVNYVKDSEKKDLIKRDNLTSLGDSKTYEVTAPKSENLKFTLVWSDYPADSSTGKTLVNDLDLIVKNSTGHRKYPYSLSWENRTDAATQNSKDEKNVVEQVEIETSQDEIYNITVNASNSINGSSQDYSLLLSEESSLKPEIEVGSPKAISYASIPTFNISSTAKIEDAKFSLDGTGNYSMTRKNSTYFYNNSVELSEGRHDVVFWANDSASYWGSKSVQFTLDTQTPFLNVNKPSKGANLSGNFTVNATWSDETTEVEKQNYTIYNSTYSETGILNDTLNSSRFADGDYNLSFNVTDSAGNFNNSTIEVTIDNTEPILNSSSPSDSQNFSSNFTINATWSDATSGVNSSEYELWNSSFSSQGDLNSSIDISELKNGDYSISYLIEDFAGNKINKTIEITVDEENPSLQVFNPSNNSEVDEYFSVNAIFSDKHTGIKEANYKISNNSLQLQRSLNDTIDTTKLSEGHYNITYTVKDFTGNENSSRINITLEDRTPPAVNLTSPENKTHLAGNFSVNATFSDGLSGIGTANYTLENESIQKTGKINSTIKSTQFKDGHYNLTANVNDSAGNIAAERHEIFIDNTAPLINNSSIVNDDNVSGLQDIDISFNESSEINMSRFMWSNSSGNQTAWKDLNNTDFNTSNLSEGEYNIIVKANDSLGNFRRTNLTGITVDNTDPNISLTEYNLTSTYRGWINNSKTVQADCTDSLTGPEKVSVNEEVNRTIPGNLTITETGNNTHSFTCHDFAGNNDSETIKFAIDSQSPNITGVSPSNNSKNLNRKFTIKAEFNNESKESGLNLSASSVNTNRGKTSLTWSNSSVKIQVSNLDYSKTVKTTGILEDNLGHSEEFYLKHNTKSEPEEDSEDDSSSGPSSPSGPISTGPVTDENNSEIDSTEEDLNQDKNSSDGEQTFTLKPGKNNITVTDEKSNVESIQTNSDKSTSVTVSESREEYEPPENTEKIDEFDISVNESENTEMNITFRVNKSRIKEDRLNDTKLYRRNNTTWQELETDYLKSTNSSHVFKSKIPDFSPFMVAVKNNTISHRNETNITENTTGNNSINEEQKQSSQAESIQSILLISVLTLLILAPMIIFTVKEYRDREE